MAVEPTRRPPLCFGMFEVDLELRELRRLGTRVHLQEGLRIDPLNAYGWEELAWAFNARELPDGKAGERAAREAVRLQPGWFWAYYQLGWALHNQGRDAEALESLNYALELDPAFGPAHVMIGRVHLARGEFRRALELFEKGGRSESSPGLLAWIATAHAGLGNDARAVAGLKKALAGGYRGFSHLESSPHFASLRAEPGFQALWRRYRE